MVKVKVVKLDDEMMKYATKEEKARVGNTYEAFLIKDPYQQKEKFKSYYALNLGSSVWFLTCDCCEVILEGIAVNDTNDKVSCSTNTRKILLVEDGSVDIDHIQDDLGIECIVYRQGANKPEILGI